MRPWSEKCAERGRRCAVISEGRVGRVAPVRHALAAGHAVRAGREALAFARCGRQHGLGPQVGSARRRIVTMLPLATIVPGAGVCEST